MKIGHFDTDERVLVVAEIGNNHEGRFDVAAELVRRAAESGANAVKFQTFRTEQFVHPRDTARFARLKSFELKYSEFEALASLARALSLLFISTPLDLESAAFLERIVDAFKVASGDNNFYPLIGQVARTRKPIVVSSGLADLAHLDRVVSFIRATWAEEPGELALLHCVSAYPVASDQVQLGAIRALAERFDCTIGYSDHTLGIDAAVLSVALGGRIIEKHFTLDKHYSDFRDHQMSADPQEMTELVAKVRAASIMLGAGTKTVQSCELPGVVAFRRSIVAARDLVRGERVSHSDLTWLRPGDGLAPGEEHTLIGRKLVREVPAGERLSAADVEALET